MSAASLAGRYVIFVRPTEEEWVVTKDDGSIAEFPSVAAAEEAIKTMTKPHLYKYEVAEIVSCRGGKRCKAGCAKHPAKKRAKP